VKTSVAVTAKEGVVVGMRSMPGAPYDGHMKIDGLLARNWLKGSEGDAIHAVLYGAGHNLPLIQVHLRVLLLVLIALTGYTRNSLSAAWQAMMATLGVAMRLPVPARSS
jgi:IS5 family transposase